MRVNREQFLAAAIALSTAAGGCKLGSETTDSAQARPEGVATVHPQSQPNEGPAGGAPTPPGEIAPVEHDYPGDINRPNTGAAPASKGVTGTSPTKEANLAAPAKEALPSPAKEALPAPAKEKLPAPTKELGVKKPTAPTAEK
jgi:hypothetical protein